MNPILPGDILGQLTPLEHEFLSRHSQLILKSGGSIEDSFFVTKPGCMVLAQTEPTPEALELFTTMNLDKSSPAVHQLVELNAKITYLSFKGSDASSQQFHEKMARELQHLSIWGNVSVTFLLAGISLETLLELIAHSECKSARLTSSKTKAMNAPLFRVQGTKAEQAFQKQYLLEHMQFRKEAERYQQARELSPQANEFFNILAPGAKASSLSYTMNLKDFHKLFIGRMNEHGNETEVQEICARMCEILHSRYPIVIRSVAEYKEMNNGNKYQS